jgi:hypothetical protein
LVIAPKPDSATREPYPPIDGNSQIGANMAFSGDEALDALEAHTGDFIFL